jgi:hypothetical protein
VRQSRAALSRGNLNFNAKLFRAKRRIRKISGRRTCATRITWHRFAHFLIDSSPRTPFAQQIMKIIFACADVESARDVDAKRNTRARKSFVAKRQRQNTIVARSPCLIDVFALPEICFRDALRARRARCRAARARR